MRVGQNAHVSDETVSQYSSISDIVVFIAMLSVACAGAIALNREVGVEPVFALSIAVACYVTGIIGHILLRKIYKNVQLQAQLMEANDAAGQTAPKQTLQVSASLNSKSEVEEKEPSALKTPLEQSSAGTKDAGLARLRVKLPKPPSPENNSGQRDRKSDIDSIIRRLADDISNGSKVHAGVSAARVKSQDQTPQPTDLKNKSSFSRTTKTDNIKLHHRQQQAIQESHYGSMQVNAADKLAAVADALAREKLDVFLEPIHGLDDGQARHFEISIRLQLENGDTMDMEDYSEAARGSVWLPLIDVVKVSHAKKVALYLLRRGHSGAFISQINGESVSTGKSFADDLASIMGHDQLMSGRLVLSITQSDVRGFTPVQWATLERLRQFGFRFAIAEVNSLDMDFEMLARRGFTFAKLDASVFCEGLPAAQTLIPPTDVCRYLAGTGMTLVVNGLVNENQKAKVLGFGAVYGQGMLFGAPRPVKAKALNMTQKAPSSASQATIS